MRRNSISYVLKKVSELPAKERAIALKQNNHPAIQAVLKCIFDKNIKFSLPPGAPPFTKNEFDDPGRLYHEYRKFYLFVEGGHPNLKQFKREMLFVELLESVDTDEAQLLILMKDKKSPHKEINRKLVEKAFPGLLPT